MCRMAIAGRAGRFFFGLSVLGLCILLLWTPQAPATEKTWDGATSDFEADTNWLGGVAPINDLTTDTAVFGLKDSLPNPVLTIDREIHTITFTDGGWTLGGAANTLSVGAGGVNYISDSTATNRITANIELAVDSTWIISRDAEITSSRTLQVDGVISGPGGFTKTGVSDKAYTMGNVYGTLRLTAPNTYTGQTILDRGGMTNIIDFNSIGNVGGGPSALGAPTTVENGTIKMVGQVALRYTGNGHATDRQLDLAGSSGYAMLYAVGSGPLTWNGDVIVTGTGTKRLALRGTSTAENAFNGLLSDGTVSLHLQKWDTGHWKVGNDSNDYTGATNIADGMVSVTSLADAGVPSALGAATGSNATITLGSTTRSVVLRYTGSGNSSTNRMIALPGTTGPIAITADGAGTIRFTNTNPMPIPGAGAKMLTFNGTNTGDNLFAIGIIDNSPTNTTSVAKSGTGRWVLAGDNTYTGTTRVEGGTLITTKPDALPGYDVTGRVSTTASGATLAVRAGAAGEWSSPEISTLLANATFAAGSNLGIEVTSGNAFEHASAIGGSQGLVKLGTGALILSGPNTYTGNTTVRAGTLQLGASDVLSHADLTVTGGATLDVQGFNQTINALYLQDGTIDGTGTLNLSATSYFTRGVINANLGGNLGTGGADRIEIGGDANATVELNGHNTFTTGGWGVLIGHAPSAGGPAGTVKLGHTHALGNTGRTSLYTGELDLNGLTDVAANYIMLRSNTAALVNNSTGSTASTAAQVMVRGGTAGNPSTDCKIGGPGNLVLSGQLTDGGNNNGFQKIGDGTLILTGSNIYTGTTTISEGILQLGNGGTTGSLSLSSAINNQAVLAFNRSDTMIQGTHFADVIGGSGELRKLSGGTVILGEDNTYTGRTILNGGVLSVSKLANGGLPSSIGASSNAQANLHFETSSTLRYTGGTVVTDRRFSLPSGVFATFDVTQSDTELTLTGQTSGVTGYVTKAGPGTLILSGVNSYIGHTTVNAGTLRVGSSGSLSGGSYGLRIRPTLGGVDAILDLNGSDLTATRHSFAVTFGGSGTAAGSDMLLSTGAGTLTFGDTVTTPSVITYDATGNPNGATISGNLNLGGLTRTFTIGDSSAADDDLTISAAIAGGAAAGLIKEDAGTLTLSGDNTYSGPTTVSAGRLLVHGTHTGGGDYTVHSGATLGGTGSIGSDVGIDSGGRLAPGASLGRLTIGGNLTLAGGVEWDWKFLNNESPDNYDQVAGPTLILPADGDSPITLNILGMPGQSVNWYDEFVLFTGSVENFDAGMFELLNNSDWTRGWAVSVGNSLILTAVPEPGTWLMLLCALAFGLLARRT